MLLILRHLESNKNTHRKFSSLEDCEELTSIGRCMGNEIAEYIATFVDAHSFNVKRVYCANSARAIETAKIIADKLGVEICAFDELRSNNSGELRGKSESEAQRINPTFMKQLKLFRAGIYSSYDFVNVLNREDKHDFENRVNLCLEKILTQDLGTLKIVVLHHSSLTAAIIHFARKFYNYPKDYYGHVACELGNIYLIGDDDILLCNEPVSMLGDIEIL
ncbi:histidine phosphatase family protein [Bariatricus sp. SGI.161]|uniref:histidine phosphatase family protein n=1 Tax=Bariatricus sp. SGI.161 TaxID=3420550 RepID=UPI003D00515C